MLSSFHELSTPVADNVHINIYLKHPLAYSEIDDSSEARYPTDVKSTGF